MRPFEVELAREQLITAPMQWLGVDLFYFQWSHFLFIVDGFSQFCWYHKFGPSPSSLQVFNVIKKIFVDFGYPKQVRYEGGLNFLGISLNFVRKIKSQSKGRQPIIRHQILWQKEI